MAMTSFLQSILQVQTPIDLQKLSQCDHASQYDFFPQSIMQLVKPGAACRGSALFCSAFMHARNWLRLLHTMLTASQALERLASLSAATLSDLQHTGPEVTLITLGLAVRASSQTS